MDNQQIAQVYINKDVHNMRASELAAYKRKTPQTSKGLYVYWVPLTPLSMVSCSGIFILAVFTCKSKCEYSQQSCFHHVFFSFTICQIFVIGILSMLLVSSLLLPLKLLFLNYIFPVACMKTYTPKTFMEFWFLGPSFLSVIQPKSSLKVIFATAEYIKPSLLCLKPINGLLLITG